MSVQVGDLTFSDWVSLRFEKGWSDTFILRISAQAGIPPFSYFPLLRHFARHTIRIRSSASIWIKVDTPGEWYVCELYRALYEVNIPFAVKQKGETPGYWDFSGRPTLFSSPPRPPSVVEEPMEYFSPDELKCLQILGRMRKGSEEDIANLTGLSLESTKENLAELAAKKLAIYKVSKRIMRGKSRPVQMDQVPLWHTRRKGLSLALQSWGVPTGTQFRSRMEDNLQQIGTKHRQIARSWPAWLKAAWPRAEIWAGWSEVRIPGFYVIPDCLAWGKIQGYETLFWLEVGDEHRSRANIINITSKRLTQAINLCRRTGARLVYTQLSRKWVREAVKWGCLGLPEDVAIVLGDWRKFGELPMVEWGIVTGK